MIIVSARKFRGAQGKYFERAQNGDSVIVKSRDYGSFKLVPVSDDDTLMSKEAFLQMLDEAEQQISEGKSKRFDAAEEAIAYFQNL